MPVARGNPQGRERGETSPEVRHDLRSNRDKTGTGKSSACVPHIVHTLAATFQARHGRQGHHVPHGGVEARRGISEPEVAALKSSVERPDRRPQRRPHLFPQRARDKASNPRTGATAPSMPRRQ